MCIVNDEIFLEKEAFIAFLAKRTDETKHIYHQNRTFYI